MSVFLYIYFISLNVTVTTANDNMYKQVRGVHTILFNAFESNSAFECTSRACCCVQVSPENTAPRQQGLTIKEVN